MPVMITIIIITIIIIIVIKPSFMMHLNKQNLAQK